MAHAVSPSVVFIQVEGKAPVTRVTPLSSPFGDEWPFGDNFFKRFFGDEFSGIPRTPHSDTPQGERRFMGQVFLSKNGLLYDPLGTEDVILH